MNEIRGVLRAYNRHDLRHKSNTQMLREVWMIAREVYFEHETLFFSLSSVHISFLVAVFVGCANRESHQHKYFIWKFEYDTNDDRRKLAYCLSHVASANYKQIYPHFKLNALSHLIQLSLSHSLHNLASKRNARILYFYWWFAKFCAKRLFDRSSYT